MNKEIYTMPEMEIINFDSEDVIVTSGDFGEAVTNGLPGELLN